MKNGLVPVKESIFQKIRRIIFKLFGKKNIKTEETQQEKYHKIYNSKFLVDIKTEVTNEPQKIIQREEFISNLENDKSLLQNLSIERLKKLSKYYDEMIEKEEIKIKKLSEN